MNLLEIGQRYLEVLRPLAEHVEEVKADDLANQPGFILAVHFRNGYGISICNNIMSGGIEELAVLRNGLLLDHAPDNTGVPSWNVLPLIGPEQAYSIAERVAGLPEAD